MSAASEAAFLPCGAPRYAPLAGEIAGEVACEAGRRGAEPVCVVAWPPSSASQGLGTSPAFFEGVQASSISGRGGGKRMSTA